MTRLNLRAVTTCSLSERGQNKISAPFKVLIIFGSSSSLKFKLSTISIGMSSTVISLHGLEISSVTISLLTSIVEDSSDVSGSPLLETIIIWEDIELAGVFLEWMFDGECLLTDKIVLYVYFPD